MWSKIRQLPLRTLSYYHPSLAFIRPIHAIGSCLRRGNKEQDLEPRPYSNIEHPSVLAHEMMTIEPGENPSRKLMWKPRVWFSHIMCRSHDDRLPMSVWETSFYSTLGVPISDLVENPRSCTCQHSDIYGDHHITSRPVNYNL